MSCFTSLYIVFLISILSLYTHPTFSQTTTCKSLKLPTTYANCNELPTLNAILHWTYTPSNSSLAVAFTAPPPKPEGWVAWGLNPDGEGMAGAQVFLAYKPSSSGPVSVDTYNLKSYSDISKGPISYNVSNTSAVESSGVITIFGTWALPKGVSNLNQVWQVGPVANGKLGKHDDEKANLESKKVLSLTDAGSAGAPGASPSGPPSSPAGDSPSGTQTSPPNAAGERLVSGGLALVAMVVCYFLF